MKSCPKRAQTPRPLRLAPRKSLKTRSAGMAELADAADSKSAGTWYLGGSTPPPGTRIHPAPLAGSKGYASAVANAREEATRETIGKPEISDFGS